MHRAGGRDPAPEVPDGGAQHRGRLGPAVHPQQRAGSVQDDGVGTDVVQLGFPLGCHGAPTLTLPCATGSPIRGVVYPIWGTPRG